MRRIPKSHKPPKTLDLPPAIALPVAHALRDAGDAAPIRRVEAVRGDLNQRGARLVTEGHSYFVKWDARPSQGRFGTEAHGLALLRASGVVCVPDVVAFEDATDDAPGWMVQRWVETRPGGWGLDLNQRLGEQLAELHRIGAERTNVARYGRHRDDYIWDTIQKAGWHDDWPTLYREQYLQPKIDALAAGGLLSTSLHTRLARLLARLDEWLGGVPRQPALLHGDLWRNNVLCDPAGDPVMVDPCAFYGDREMELAYTEYWRNFAPRFYEAYEATWPSAPRRAERRPLYLLWYQLHDVQVRGVSHLPAVEMTTRWLVGA